jgi:hypothetical protein
MQRVATDAVIGRMRSLPRTISRLDAQSLSDIMGRRVTSVSVIGGDAGTSSRARLALYAYVAPLITAGMGGMQDESIALEGVKRGVAALTDLETVAALKQSLS